MIDDWNESLDLAGYVAAQVPTLGAVLQKDLPIAFNDWVIWNRFWQLVVCDTETKCWLWRRPLNSDGYGSLKCSGRNQPIHRIVFEWLVGPIPPELVIDHLCRTRHCVNPAHLEAVSNAENVRRGVGALARNGRKTSCPQGHPYDEANTIWLPDNGGRRCRICREGYYAAHRERIQELHAKYYRERVGREVLPPNGERTQCKWGHAFDETNTRMTTAGVRQCRTCGNRRDRERYANDPARNASVKARVKASKIAKKLEE